MSGHNTKCPVWQKTNTAYQHEHLIPTVKHGGGGLVIWACFAATGPGHLAVIESIINSSVYQSILVSNLSDSQNLVGIQSCKRTMIPNTAANLQKISSDLNLIKMLWWDLNRDVDKEIPANTN